MNLRIHSMCRVSAALRVMLRIGFLAALMFPLLQPSHVVADVATKAGEKKKDRDDPKKDKKFDFLPESRPVAATFTAGQPVEIELAAAVGSLKQMEFAIRQMPRHGSLSAVRAHLRESNKGVVTYTHAGGDAPLTDSFTYACKLEGGSWSAPATVTLSGQRMEPKIEVVGIPQFGRVFLGGQASTRVAVRNKGTADFRMEMKWPEPFTGPPSIEVLKGGTAEFQVFVQPVKTGEFRHELVFQPGVPEARAIFFVLCLQAFSVSPGNLTLSLDEKTGERSGVLSLANSRPGPVRVVMKHPARLQGPVETEVAAVSRSDLRIALPAGDVEAFSGEIVIQAGDDTQKVTVQSGPKPAVMQVLIPASLSLDFGVVAQRSVAEREVVVSNAGGEPLIVEARTRPPYSIGQTVKSLRLEPRAQGRFKVSLQTDGLGSSPGELELVSNSSRVIVALSAEVRDNSLPVQSPPPASPGVSSSVPAPLTAATPAKVFEGDDPFAGRNQLQAAMMAFASSRGLPIPKGQINPYLERVTGLEVLDVSRTDVTIAWPRPSVAPSGWVVEMASQVLDPSTGIFVKLWSRHRDWETASADGDNVAIRLLGLQPATLYEIRVMGVDREGKVSEPAESILIQTAQPWQIPSWVWRLFIVAALFFVGYRLYRMRRGNYQSAPA